MFHLPENRLTWGIYLLLMALLMAMTFGSLSALRFDTHDNEFILDSAELLSDLSPDLFLQNSSIQGRPTFNLYIWAAYKICGEDPAGYHILQAVLHLVASLLLGATCRRLGAPFELSLVAGLLFLMNVAHFRAVHWISATGYILALIFGLSTVLLYHRALQTHRLRWLLGSAVGLAAAIFAHPASIAVLFFCPVLAGYQKYPLRKVLYGMLVLGLTTVACSLFVLVTYPDTAQIRAIVRLPGVASILQNLCWFWGRQLTTAHWLPDSLALDRPNFWELGIGALFFSGALGLSFRSTARVVPWAAWSFLLTLPFLSADMGDNAAGPSRYLYLSSAGFSVLLAGLLCFAAYQIAERTSERIGRVLLAGGLTVLVATSFCALKNAEAVSLYQSGRFYIARGSLGAGVEQLHRAFERDAGLVPIDAYIRLATVDFAVGKSQQTLLERGLERDPDAPELHMLLGISAYLEADPDVRKRGDERVQNAFERSEDKGYFRRSASLAYFNLADYYRFLEQDEQAGALYRKAIAWRPNYPVALKGLGDLLYAQGKVEEAIGKYQEAVRLTPEDASTLKKLAHALYNQGRREEALRLYRDVVWLSPEDAAAHYRLGQILNALDRKEEEVKAYAQAVQVDPDHLEAWRSLGNLFYRRGRLEGAIQAYREVVRIDPENVSALKNLGYLFYKGGQYAEAVGFYRRAVQRSPKELKVYLGLAQVYEKWGRVEAAVGAYRSARALDPDNAVAGDRLQVLLQGRAGEK